VPLLLVASLSDVFAEFGESSPELLSFQVMGLSLRRQLFTPREIRQSGLYYQRGPYYQSVPYQWALPSRARANKEKTDEQD
jgi:hypothetical protein